MLLVCGPTESSLLFSVNVFGERLKDLSVIQLEVGEKAERRKKRMSWMLMSGDLAY